MYDVRTWPHSMRLLSPVQLGAMLLALLQFAGGLLLCPPGPPPSSFAAFMARRKASSTAHVLRFSVIAVAMPVGGYI